MIVCLQTRTCTVKLSSAPTGASSVQTPSSANSSTDILKHTALLVASATGQKHTVLLKQMAAALKYCFSHTAVRRLHRTSCVSSTARRCSRDCSRDCLSVRPLSVYCDSLTANTYRHLCGKHADLTAAKNTFHLLVGVVDELW